MSCSTKSILPKAGDRVKVVANTSGHNIPIGTVVTLSHPNGVAGWFPVGYTVYMNHHDFKLACEDEKVTKERLEKQLKCAEARVSLLKCKLDYMSICGCDHFCEDEWKVYRTLQVLANTDLDQMGKAKAIAKLLNAGKCH